MLFMVTKTYVLQITLNELLLPMECWSGASPLILTRYTNSSGCGWALWRGDPFLAKLKHMRKNQVWTWSRVTRLLTAWTWKNDSWIVVVTFQQVALSVW